MVFDIVGFTPDDVMDGHNLTQQLGWPHTLDDWKFAASAGTGYAVRHDGQLIGTSFTWRLDHKTATLGLLVVAPSVQGCGLGRALLRKSIADHPERSILLHATEVAVPLYLSEGFVPGVWINQIQGLVGIYDLKSSAKQPSFEQHSIRTLCSPDLDAIMELDHRASGVERTDLLKAIFAKSDGVVQDCDGGLTGFALCRRFGRGAVIGPVVGKSPNTAQSMVHGLLTSMGGEFVRIDTVGNGIDATWLARFGLHRVDRVRTMVRGVWPSATCRNLQRFALAGHAFG